MTQAPSDIRVLLVDDTPDMRLLLRVLLGRYQGITVVAEAGDGAEGIEQAARHRPDVVLLDLAMPRVDGLEALPRIRRVSPASKVIVLSGFEADRMAGPALAAGASAYVHKAAASEELLGAVAAALGRPVPELRPDAPPASSRRAQPAAPDPAAPHPSPADGQVRQAIARVAHELRNPTLALSILAEELRTSRSRRDEATVDQMLDAIVRQTELLDQLTTDLLTSTHAGRGALVVNPAPQPLPALLRSVVAAAPDDVEVVLDCPPDLTVLADHVRFHQMITNLLSNAVKYGAPPVLVQARATAEHAEIRVIDHGPGVPPWFRDQLFDEYSRARPDEGTGSGIGLYIVRSIAEAQSGTAWYEPRPDGSAFCVSLPLAELSATASR